MRDDIEEHDRHWSEDDECLDERAARRIQWLLIAAFVCAAAAGMFVS